MKLKGLKELIRGLRIKDDKIEAEIEAKSKIYRDLKAKEIAEAEKAWMCKDDPKKFCREMTEDEAKCYWILQTKNAGDFHKEGLKLNKTNAEFSWNYEANSQESIKGKTACRQFPSTMLPLDAVPDVDKPTTAADALKALMAKKA